jgi:hypothetical protein
MVYFQKNLQSYWESIDLFRLVARHNFAEAFARAIRSTGVSQESGFVVQGQNETVYFESHLQGVGFVC